MTDDERHEDIRRRHADLLGLDTNLRTAVLKGISSITNPLFWALEVECGDIGHEWVFSSRNMLGDRVDRCVWCKKTELAEDHGGDTSEC